MSDINIKITEHPVSLIPGGTKTLKVTGIPETDKAYTVEWTSSDAGVVAFVGDTKDKSEVTIKAESLGEATVKASVTYDGQTYESACEVTVWGITLEKSDLLLEKGKAESLKYHVNPSESTITWSSDNSCVSVDSNGTITAKASGKATVKASVTYGDQKYDSACDVTVWYVIGLNKSDLVLGVGETERLESVVDVPESSETRITWSSSNNSCVSVNSNGKITTHKPGEATITAKIEYLGKTYKSECRVIVCGLAESELSFILGGSKTIEAIIPEGASVTWASKNTGVATVSSDTEDVKKATITAVASGTTDVTATIVIGKTTYTLTCQVTVKNPNLVSLDISALSLILGKTKEIEATVPEKVKEITWASKDGEVATVESDAKDKNKATITAKGPGQTEITATIKYQDEEYTATCYVTVGVISLDSSELPLIVGETKTIKATVPEEVKEVTWESNNKNIATVPDNSTDTSVVVTAVAPGQATISATVMYGDMRYTKKCHVTVEGIRLQNSEVELDVNGAKSITAEVPEKAKVTWTSEDEGIATVPEDSAGTSVNVTAVAPGTTAVTAMIEINKTKYTATCKVKVINKISLDSSAFSFDIGEKQTIKATVPENTTITWESGNKDVATVSNSSGIEATITAIAPGETVITATITYKDIKYSATCKVTVNPLRLNRDKLTLLKEKEFQLEVIPSGLSVKWSSSNESVASVKNGLVTACLEGTTQVTATVEIREKEYSATCLVTVEDKALDVLVNLANERFEQYKDIKDKYRFSFTPEGKMDEMVLVQGEEAECEFNDNSTNIVYSFVLTEVSFHKEIYQPGYVEVVIKTNAALSLFGGWVSLEYIKEEEEFPYTIAQNYYIFEKKKKRGYVTLKAYSADQFLTLDKFCQVYTGKTLVDGMIATTFENYVNTVNFNKYCTAVGHEKYVANLQHLKLTVRIPYAVQYNESFYDFLIRMCNRHGEFLYCEGNQLHIGLQASAVGTEIPKIEEDDDVEIESSESGWTYTNEVKTMFSDCLEKKGVGGTYNPEEKKIERPQNQMVANDSIYPGHYFEKYQKSGVEGYEYAAFLDFISILEEVFTALQTIAESPTLADVLVKTAFKMSIKNGVLKKAQNKVNDTYNETYFNEEKMGKKTSYYPFSSPDDRLNDDSYNDILQKETEAEKNKVTVTCSTCQKYQLGDRVKIEGKEHVVYRVKGSAKVVDGVLDGVRRYVDSYELLLLPTVDGKYYPLPMPERRILKASPQRAIVKNPMDPQKLGRVQVAYPWQSENDANLSPWLRVAYPMATGEGGFMFFPAIGDEVLVDYEGGNIERPFVAGSFYSADRKPADPAQMHLTGVTKSITSANGHHISFMDPKDNRKFAANLVPIWSLFTKFGVDGPRKEWWETHGKHFVGGFEISDYFGVYSIKGNTEDRSISIESPLGDITLDAFTGITINAPHGDVKIVGKNVDIEARNNLTITSGTNIKNSFIGSRRHGGKWDNTKKQLFRGLAVFSGSAFNLLGLDLSFYRTCLEVIFRPIGGTMLIKSHRFMHIEAGDGEVPLQSVRKESEGALENVSAFFSHWLIRRSFSDKKTGEPLDTQFRNRYEEIDNAFSLFLKVESKRNSVLTKRNEIFNKQYEDKEYWEKLESASGNNTQDDFKTAYDEVCKTKNKTPETDVKQKYVDLGGELFELKEIYKKISNLKSDDSSIKIISSLMKSFGDDKTSFITSFKESKELAHTPDNEITKTSLVEKWKVCLYKNVSALLNDKEGIKIPDWDASKSAIDNLGRISYTAPTPNAPTPPSKFSLIGHAFKMAALKSTGTEGLKDENMWSIKDKGGIYFSAEKGHTFHLTTDGSLREYYKGKDLYTLVYDSLKRIIEMDANSIP